MRTPDSDFIEEKNKDENSPIRLYTIEDYDGSSNDITLAENDEDVVFDSVTYTKFPIVCERISENTQGEIDYVRLILANVSQVIQGYLHSYDFRGKKVTITTVFRDHLDEPDAAIQDVYYIDSYIVDLKNVALTLTSKFDLLDVELPFRKYARTYCSWKFKSTECGYGGEENTCNRTLQRCRELDNVLRFGGFPSVPSRRMFIQ
jgi:lambda family phage minor tail protein L